MLVSHDTVDKVLGQVRIFTKTEVSREQSLINSGLIESIDLVDLVVALEKTFQIKLSARDMTAEKLDTVEKIAATIQPKLR